MHGGSSNSITLVVTAAGLAMITAATFLVQAENEKKLREQQEDAAAAARRGPVLERQLSTISRSKRDRVIYNDNDDGEEEEDEKEETIEKPPVITILGVPPKNTDTTTSMMGPNCPNVVDVSFDNTIEDGSSCDESSSIMQLAGVDDHHQQQKLLAVPVAVGRNDPWKGTKAFFWLALLWALGVYVAPVWVGTKSMVDVRRNLEVAANQTWPILERFVLPTSENVPSAVIAAATETHRPMKGAYGPFFGA